MNVENGFKSGVKCKICGAQPSIVTPIGNAYCESCSLALNGLRIARRCTHCGKSLKQDVIAKGDVFCSINCVVNQQWGTIRANLEITDNQKLANQMRNEADDYRFDLDF